MILVILNWATTDEVLWHVLAAALHWPSDQAEATAVDRLVGKSLCEPPPKVSGVWNLRGS